MLDLFRRLRLRKPRDSHSKPTQPSWHVTSPDGRSEPTELFQHTTSQDDHSTATKCPYLRSPDRAWAFMSHGPLYESLTVKHAFRFLFLHPSDTSDQPIVCSLFQHALAEGFDYTALSYEWGTPAVNGRRFETLPKQRVIVNGKEIEVSANLFDALVHVRASLENKMAGVLWVDALCINQEDVIERGHQVAQMRKIYRQAHQVLCWLGPATTETGSRDPKRSSRDIMQRSYWQRVWIIQEFVLAKSVDLMCGELFFSIEEIEDGTKEDPERYARLAGFYSLRDLRSRFVSGRKTEKSTLSFLEALQLSGRSSATDSRDLVYAILSLVRKKELLGLEPDYTLSPCEVFCNALWILSETTTNSIQYAASLREEKHYSTFRADVDPHLDGRKACNGKRGCQTLMKMQVWHDDTKRNSYLGPRRDSSDSLGSRSHRSVSPAPRRHSLGSPVSRRNSASPLESPRVTRFELARKYPPVSMRGRK